MQNAFQNVPNRSIYTSSTKSSTTCSKLLEMASEHVPNGSKCVQNAFSLGLMQIFLYTFLKKFIVFIVYKHANKVTGWPATNLRRLPFKSSTFLRW